MTPCIGKLFIFTLYYIYFVAERRSSQLTQQTCYISLPTLYYHYSNLIFIIYFDLHLVQHCWTWAIRIYNENGSQVRICSIETHLQSLKRNMEIRLDFIFALFPLYLFLIAKVKRFIGFLLAR